jgi:NitT/TauT family transport system substrate-binding protein
MLRRLSISFASAALIAVASTAASADKTKLTVSTLFGVNYLSMSVMKHGRLIEQQAATMGLGAISVTFTKLGGGTAANDALLSGSVDVAAGGTPTIMQIWSATIRDFTEQDRIAVPAAKVGLQATLLPMECAKLFGEANFAKLDYLTVTMPHPGALAALLSGSRGSIILRNI